jgi:sodium transport system permease protein
VSPVLVVFLKELRDGLRDRRALFSLLLFPLVGPVLIAVMLTQTASELAPEARQRLPVVGREHAPGLCAFLEERGIEVVEPPADPLAAVRDREVAAVLIIPSDFGSRFAAGKPATAELIVDESRSETLAAVGRVRRTVQAYGSQVGTLRLLARGVSPELAQPIVLAEVDLSTPKKRAAIFLNIIPMFVLLAAFIGGMYTATDSTAGERERGSLEPLLLNPVARRSLALGKWLATVCFSIFTVVFTLGSTLLALAQVPLARFGLSLAIDAGDVAWLVAVMVPLPLFVAGAQLLVASFARSFKEAQTYLSLMVFLPMLPALLTTVRPMESEAWMMAVPVLGQQVLLTDVLRGEVPSLLALALTSVASLGAGYACVLATAALFRREKVIYGR